MQARRLPLPIALCALLAVLPACGDDDDPIVPQGPFDLAFTGDASFQDAHGGQELHVVVQDATEDVVASESATVSASADPAFSFDFNSVLEEGQDYRILYFIDSNFGDGTAGVCDPPDVDHQWAIAVDDVSEDVTVDDTHRPGETESVCEAFTADLSFAGDDSFQGAHGGQTLTLSVVREGTDEVVASESTTVSATEDPSFSFSFPGLLLLDGDYRVEYWIDSNFEGGTEGVCGPPSDDHQWSVDLGTVTEDVDVTDTHRPTETEPVCDGAGGSGSGDGGDTGGDGTDTGDDTGDPGY